MPVGLALKDPSAALVRRLAPLAESRGYTAMLFPELSIVGQSRHTGRDPFVSSAIALERTQALRAGPGVAGTVFHSARHLALRAASLMESSDGRFILGCGVSHRAYAEEIGVDYPSSPIGHVRTYLAELRAAGGRLAFGEPAPIWLAALGDRMATVGAELADGLLLNWVSPSWVERTVAHLLASVGQRPVIAVYIRLDTGERLREQAQTYLTMFDNYAKHFARQGLVDPEQIAWETGVPIDDPAAIATRVSAYREAGADEVVLYPADVAPERIERFVDELDVTLLGA
ncbi:MAG: LLM class flavin-dependent oxidoreductase [Nitriliruptoraceae bacterium]